MDFSSKRIKNLKLIVSLLDSKTKAHVLKEMAKELHKNRFDIVRENKKDIEYAKNINLSSEIIDRLSLNLDSVINMADALVKIANLDEPVGRVISGFVSEDNLLIEKVTTPIGAIAVIYESRPNVTSDVAALCFKSGNVSILKGGKEAKHSNLIISEILRETLSKNSLPKDIVTFLKDNDRQAIAKIIKMDKCIDLVIPRGGASLIKYIVENSTVPVVKHDKGLCHTYIDKYANIDKAVRIAINAKTQRSAVCNSMETLLVDKAIASKILPILKEEFDKYNTTLRGCVRTLDIIPIEKATKEDFQEEYLANILSIRVVDGVKGAIEHIIEYGSNHSEAIITDNYSNAQIFLNSIDAATVYLNASTRFTDGGKFGFGAEVGISTNKLHARGPMGINELLSYKFKIYGNGQVRT